MPPRNDAEVTAAGGIGQTIGGKYLLTQLLGSGGMGAVYEAVHQFTKRRVAVKLMHSELARSQVFAERFLREAQAPSSIGHPGIVEVLDGGRTEDGALYLVLELLEGETLAQVLRERKVSESELCALALELLDALAAAHSAGFVHRDIKPDNIFLVPTVDGTPMVKLLDFGVAGVLAGADEKPALTQAGTVLGTPLYMSPEQALGKSVDGRSDLWAVGAVMYQALGGDPPFGGESVQAVIVSIATQQHAPLGLRRPGLSAPLVAVVERALRKNVAQRWQSAHEMAQALVAAQPHAARPASAQVPVPLPVSSPATHSHGRAALALLAASVLIAGFVFARTHNATVDGSMGTAARALPPAATTPAPAPEKPAPPDEPTARSAPTPLSPATPAADDPTLAAPQLQPAAAVPSARTSAAITRILGEHQNELRRCYEDAVVPMLMKAGETGVPTPAVTKLEVDLRITADGAVEHARLRGDAPEAMRPCALSVLNAWRFPSSGEASEISFPVVFQPTVLRQ